MLEHDTKKTVIFDYPKQGEWEYEFVGQSKFALPFSKTLADEIASYYAKYVDGVLFNNDAICLENIESKGNNAKIYLGACTFYDFLLANVIGREAQDPKDGILANMEKMGAPVAVLDGVKLLGQRFLEAKKSVRSLKECIEHPYLPGMIAISTLVSDEGGNYLVSQRTGNVIIGKYLGGVTSTGTLEFEDILKKRKDGTRFDPFCACASRELSEESALAFPPDYFETKALFIGKAKLQPIAIVDAVIDVDLTEYRSSSPRGTDRENPELRQIRSIRKKDIQALVFKYDMTEAASYHLLSHAYDKGESDIDEEERI